jgi:hypothetical protein
VLAKIQQLLLCPTSSWGGEVPDLDSNQDYLIQSCTPHVFGRTSASGNFADLQVFCDNLGLSLSAACRLVPARLQYGCSIAVNICKRELFRVDLPSGKTRNLFLIREIDASRYQVGRYEFPTTKSPELIFRALLGDHGAREVRFERTPRT